VRSCTWVNSKGGGMGFLKALQKVAQGTVDLAMTPVEAVKDAVTLGNYDGDEPHTVSRLKKATRKAEEAYDALDDD
jgi:hypothetical protein